jgi:hypothetical protein
VCKGLGAHLAQEEKPDEAKSALLDSASACACYARQAMVSRHDWRRELRGSGCLGAGDQEGKGSAL